MCEKYKPFFLTTTHTSYFRRSRNLDKEGKRFVLLVAASPQPPPLQEGYIYLARYTSVIHCRKEKLTTIRLNKYFQPKISHFHSTHIIYFAFYSSPCYLYMHVHCLRMHTVCNLAIPSLAGNFSLLLFFSFFIFFYIFFLFFCTALYLLYIYFCFPSIHSKAHIQSNVYDVDLFVRFVD